MIIEEIRTIKSTKKEIRDFGIILGIILAIFGTLFFIKGRAFYFYFFICSSLLIAFALFKPELIKPVQKVWMTVSVIIGWFATRIILFILFYAVLTPIAVIARLLKNKFLEKDFDKTVDTYWMPIDQARFDKCDYTKQF